MPLSFGKMPISVSKPNVTYPASATLSVKTRNFEGCARGLPVITIRQGRTLVSVRRVRDDEDERGSGHSGNDRG